MEPTTDYRAVASHGIIEVMKLFRLILREVVTMSLLDGPRPVLFEFKTHKTSITSLQHTYCRGVGDIDMSVDSSVDLVLNAGFS